MSVNSRSHPDRIVQPIYVNQQGVHKTAKMSKCPCDSYWFSKKWYSRSKLERIFFVLVLTSFIVIIGLSIAVNVYKKASHEEKVDLCLSKKCVVSSGLILESLDLNINPCENFHDFACGGFMEKSLIPHKSSSSAVIFNRPVVDFFSDQLNVFHARVKSIIDEPHKQTDPKSLLSAKILYASCLNTERIEELKTQPLLEILQKLGNWPVIVGKQWEDLNPNWNWVDTLIKLSSQGFDASVFFTLTIYKYKKPKNEYLNVKEAMKKPIEILTITKPQLKFPIDEETFNPSNWENDPRTRNYFNYMVNASVLLGANRTIAEEDMEKVIKFKITLIDFIIRGHSDNPIKLPVSGLQKQFPQIPWLKFLSEVLPIQVTGTEEIRVESQSAIQNILELVEKTPKRTLANFILWSAVHPNLQYLDKKSRDLTETFDPYFFNNVDASRWFVCLQTVWTSIVTPAAIYVRKHVTQADKNMVEELINAIRQELIPVIEKLHGLKPGDRQKTLDLLAVMQYYIFPDEFFSDGQLDQFYLDLSFSKEDYFHNMLNLLKFLKEIKFKVYFNSDTSQHWAHVHFPFHVKYNLGNIYDNTVEIPFYMLIGFNFNGKKPRFINYASLATYLGTEIIQLLPEEVRDRIFSDRDRCNRILLERPNGNAHVSDNMEIMASLKVAYDAYKKWTQEHVAEKSLPGLNFTPSQLFWITDATMACMKYEKHGNEQEYVYSRINIPASNLKEFSEDFSCPTDSFMNPVDKCNLW